MAAQNLERRIIAVHEGRQEWHWLLNGLRVDLTIIEREARSDGEYIAGHRADRLERVMRAALDLTDDPTKDSGLLLGRIITMLTEALADTTGGAA